MTAQNAPIGKPPELCSFAEMAAAEHMGFLDLDMFKKEEIDAYRVHTADCVYCLFYRNQAAEFDAEEACDKNESA